MKSRSFFLPAIAVTFATMLITVGIYSGKRVTTAAATDKSAQQKAAKSDPLGTINGAESPTLIPDRVAYEFLFRSLAVRQGASDLDQRRGRLSAQVIGLEGAQGDVLRTVAEEFQQRVGALDRQVKQIKDRAWPNPSSEVMAELAGLQAQKEALIAEIVASLPNRLGPNSLMKVSQHINNNVKRRVKIVPGPPLPSRQHH